MHEMSIASELLEQVLRVAEDNGAVEIESVELKCGEMKQVVYEALDIAWSAVTEGTPAEGSRLDVEEVPMKARCRLCLEQFRPAVDDYRCPGCGQADIDMIEGNDIVLQSIACRRPE